jgi:hypothetical protein
MSLTVSDGVGSPSTVACHNLVLERRGSIRDAKCANKRDDSSAKMVLILIKNVTERETQPYEVYEAMG